MKALFRFILPLLLIIYLQGCDNSQGEQLALKANNE